jgi:thiol-disulfide isomerase/thioredoxin
MARIKSLPKAPKFKTLNNPPRFKYVLIFCVMLLVVFSVLYSTKIFNFKPEHFQEKTKWIVKLIYSDTCPHCVAFKPTFEAVSQDKEKYFPGMDVEFVKASVKDSEEYSQFINNGIPVVLIMQNAHKPDAVDPSKTLVGNIKIEDFVKQLKERLH